MPYQYPLPFIGAHQLVYVPDDAESERISEALSRQPRIFGQYSLAPLWMDKEDESDGSGVTAWALGAAVVTIILVTIVLA